MDPQKRTQLQQTPNPNPILLSQVGKEEEEEDGFSLGSQNREVVQGFHHLPKKRSYHHPSEDSPSSEYAQFASVERMGESHHHHHHLLHPHHQQQQHQQQHQHQSSSRMALRNAGGGEIVEVQGGHIVRSTGRKDRHSKVCTAKGPRDRRVRLSAHTAIKFYDVQDRLGYDRPSKAVDWLIKNAKPAIDELDELPPWQPTSYNPSTHKAAKEEEEEDNSPHLHNQPHGMPNSASKKPLEAEISGSGYGYQHLGGNPNAGNTSSFLPPALDSDAIADTIKSFFPIPASTSSIHFQNYPPDLLSRTSSQTQDLRLSLQSFQDPILLQSNQQILQSNRATPSGEQALFTGSAPLVFDSAASGSWSEHQQQQQQQETGRFQRMIAWNPADASGSTGGYLFGGPPPLPLQPLLGQNPFSSQRGPLQSSNSPSLRAWGDPPAIATAEYQMLPSALLHPSSSSISAIGFASGGFSGFRIPARIQGEEEHDAVTAHKPPSTSSAPRH